MPRIIDIDDMRVHKISPDGYWCDTCNVAQPYCTGQYAEDGEGYLTRNLGYRTPPQVVLGFDSVHHPKHYNSHPSGIECIEIVRHHSFNIGNAIKYLWRAGLKDGVDTTQDLEKSLWYIQDEIQRIRRASSVTTPEPAPSADSSENSHQS